MSQTTWVHRGARVLMRPLARTAVTPNQVTTLRLLTGIAAAAAFMVGERSWDIAAGALFVVSAFLDRADGELARLTGKTSASGDRYDLVCDAASNVMAFTAIGIGLSRGALGVAAVLMGIVAAIGIAGGMWINDRLNQAGHEVTGSGDFDPDDALFIVGPAAWFGALTPLLVAGAVGAPLFFVYAASRYRKRVRAASPLESD